MKRFKVWLALGRRPAASVRAETADAAVGACLEMTDAFIAGASECDVLVAEVIADGSLGVERRFLAERSVSIREVYDLLHPEPSAGTS